MTLIPVVGEVIIKRARFCQVGTLNIFSNSLTENIYVACGAKLFTMMVLGLPNK